ncbi:carboxymuconolactone decarboxylase family protein [Aminomonas paucivorans]|uniref:carboxymuconolactone decarboxylase family protein n=1 Tax=Aminomonas paucivorans TaxID=81412 RepID=UPI00331F915E
MKATEGNPSFGTGKPSPAEEALGAFAPKLVELTDQVLFGDIWKRPGLSPRDRSLITLSALIALNRTEQLGFHLEKGMDHGLTREEIVEAITHLAFYAGWPCGMSAAGAAKNLFARRTRSS